MSDYTIEDLGNGKKRLIIEYDENSEGTLSSTGKSHVIASSNGFKPVGKVKIAFNVIRK
jgi:hypothetical protein